MSARAKVGPLAVSRRTAVWTLAISPGAGPAELAAGLSSAAREIDLDSEARAVVLRGARRGAWDARPRPDMDGDAWAAGVAAVAALRVPVIALLDEAVTGLGFELALACDLRLAEAGGKFRCGFVEEGCFPMGGLTQRLPRVVGTSRATWLLLAEESLSAAAATRMGLVHEVVSRGALARRGRALAKEIARRGPVAQRLAKEAVRAAQDLPLAEGLRLEGDLYVLLQSTSDRDEGIASFAERRPPRFRGK